MGEIWVDIVESGRTMADCRIIGLLPDAVERDDDLAGLHVTVYGGYTTVTLGHDSTDIITRRGWGRAMQALADMYATRVAVVTDPGVGNSVTGRMVGVWEPAKLAEPVKITAKLSPAQRRMMDVVNAEGAADARHGIVTTAKALAKLGLVTMETWGLDALHGRFRRGEIGWIAKRLPPSAPGARVITEDMPETVEATIPGVGDVVEMLTVEDEWKCGTVARVQGARVIVEGKPGDLARHMRADPETGSQGCDVEEIRDWLDAVRRGLVRATATEGAATPWTVGGIDDLYARALSVGYTEMGAASLADCFTNWDMVTDPCSLHPNHSTTIRGGYRVDSCEACDVIRLSADAGYLPKGA